MKHGKLLVLLGVLLVLCSLVFVSCADEADEHEYTTWSIVQDPTETTPGKATGTCICGESKEFEIPALTDAIWAVEKTEPTHSETGLAVYTSVYGTVKVILPVVPHEWTINITTEPTDTAIGTAVRICDCGESEELDVPALSDTSVWKVTTTLPTHKVAGKAVYTSEYGTVTVILPVIPHTYGNWSITTDPTKEAEGVATRACECGETEKVSLPVLTDTAFWNLTVRVDATHAATGYEVYTSVYGTVTYTLAVIPHTYGAWSMTTEPTPDTVGSAVRTCECGESETAEVPALSDETVWTYAVITPASHTEAGSAAYTSVYGTVNVTLPLIPDHVFGEWTIVTEPTAETTGTATRSCACGETDTATLPVLTDSSVWTVERTAPTYNEAGRDVYTSEYGTVTVTVAKIRAPYDEKTYVVIDIDTRNFEKNNQALTPGFWNTASLTLDKNGSGMGTAFPFRGYTVITMTDAATGRVNIRVYELTSVSSGTTDPDDPWGDGEPEYGSSSDTQYVVNYDEYVDYVGYVDFATGMVMRVNEANFGRLFLYTPFETAPTSDRVKLSVWNGKYIAGTYTYDGTDYSFFSDGSRVWFGVSFTDGEGNAVAADAACNAPYVYVKDASGNAIVVFGYDGSKQNVLDGLEGSYANGDDMLVLSGYGKLTLAGVAGEYVKAAAEAGYDLDVWTLDESGKRVAYFRVTLGEGTYTFTAPKVTISFDAGEYDTVDAITVDMNVTPVLPRPDNAAMAFRGWYFDAACTQPVGDDFLPTSDVTLYASWKAKVVIHLVGVLEGDETTLYIGEGDEIFGYLPVYGLNIASWKKFVGWYYDTNNDGVWDEGDSLLESTATVTAEDSGCNVIALWADLPAYYGTFYGGEVYNAGYGNYGGKTLTIDEDGNITGSKTGKVISYDPETQIVKWKSGTKEYTFYYDSVSGVIAGIYNDNTIDNDYWIMSRETATDGKVPAQFGVKAPKTPGSTTTGYYAQFVKINCKLGNDTVLFLYNNHIYANVTVTNAAGEALDVNKDAAGSIKNSKTVIVRAADGTRLMALAATDASFGTGSNTQVLDEYFGTYTNGDETVVLDGVGGITYGTGKGTYALRTDGLFDVYIRENGEDKEYYVLTVLDGEFVMDKPTVDIMYMTEYGTLEADTVTVNKNIAVTLPAGLTSDTMFFRGWYLDGDETKTLLPATYKPTADVILVAKWDAKYTVTVVYNDGTTTDTTFAYGAGDKVTIPDPTYIKHKFDGWFTTPAFDEGTEWTSGSVITASVTIYAKWSEAPIYSNTYTPVEVTGTGANGSTSSVYIRSTAVLNIDPNGVSASTGYPFNGGTNTVKNYDPATGYLELHSGSKVYKGYIDAATGMIVITNSYNASATFGEVIVLTLGKTAKIDDFSSSYWNSGKSRAIEYSYTDENGDAQTLRVFVYNDKVYFGVSFKDALTDGNNVAGKDCCKSNKLFVFDRDGTEIARFGYDGTTMVALDGYEGTYANGDDALILNGIDKVTFGGHEGTYTKAADNAGYTFDVYMTEDGKTVYYELTVDRENGTYTIEKPMVAITFVTEYGTVETLTVNKNISLVLPVPTDATHVFKGWYLDAAFGEAVGTTITPSGDVTLHALWKDKVTVTLVGVMDGDADVLYVGEGDHLSPVIPSYTIDLDKMKLFVGWYVDANGNGIADDGDTLVTSSTTAAGTAMTVIAVWRDVPAYYGTFYGTELYGQSSGNSASSKVTIDENGKISGTKNGTVISYDPETQILIWNSGSGADQIACYDEKSGVLVIGYYSPDIGHDFYIFSRENTGHKVAAQYAVKVPPTPASTDEAKYYARFIQMKTRLGDDTILLVYNNHIYAGITLTDSEGNAVAISAIGNTKQLNVNDAATGENLIRFSASTNLGSGTAKVLDPYYGTYTNGDETIVLDGVGGITYGDKTGTYFKGENGTLDVYFAEDGKNVSYAVLTLNGTSFTITYPTVTVTYESEYGSFEAVTVNRNIAILLPSIGLVEGDYTLVGWYLKSDTAKALLPASYIPTEDVTLVAKWGGKVTLTIVYGNGMENAELKTLAGATISLDAYQPGYTNGKAFDGWYMDANCTVAFTATSIDSDMTVYCKWIEKAPYTMKDSSSTSARKFTYSNGTWKSGNVHADSTTSAFTITVSATVTVSFTYAVDSESTYDWFKVTRNGTQVLQKSGEVSDTFTIELSAGDELRILYVKDSSGYEGTDCVKITNLKVGNDLVTTYTD